ncbi:putative alpha beta hydrolase fold protein [Neofusicoccum parvum]|uniref:Alpha beta hydrolase fold protein n=2 Tax=Neofusicoccum parvum TaxID=310453 RepID=A0ACB5RTX5_9PEZI|nr:putative alpha beta hydrolase fold protein [Neofusicoccum parvum UCRNP2]GME24007.1 putative alpha beta hydrolase fold protein [Neofusicoccum parvum]GME55731.1 putative alpha beta hydrolase fold protein [Neofusicoccum parvum]
MAPRPRTADLRLGFFEKLGLVPIFAAVLGKTFWTALTAKFISKNKRPSSFARLLGYTALRTLLNKNSSRTEQASAPGTEENYLAWCKQANVQPVTETLKDGTNAYWVGSRGAEKVWIYFHGGGYSIPAYVEQFQMLHSLVKDLNDDVPGGIAALVLHYDVAPWAAYPRQLAQAAALLNHVRSALGVPAANIIVGGDSAGGNLTLGLLSHALHPHPDAALVPRVELAPAERLRAAVLISPWASFDTRAASFERNRHRDMLGPAALGRWATLFLGGRPTDPYNEPVDVPAGWWKGLGGVVRDVLFLGGEYEVLLDGILNCAESVRNEWKGEGEVGCVVAEGEAHDSAWVDTLWGFKKEELGMYREMRDWLKTKL